MTQAQPPIKKQILPLPPGFSIGGQLNLNGRYLPETDSFIEGPTSYLRSRLDLDIEALGIPLQFDLQYSTDGGWQMQNLQRLSLKLDAPALKRMAQQKLNDQKQTLKENDKWSSFVPSRAGMEKPIDAMAISKNLLSGKLKSEGIEDYASLYTTVIKASDSLPNPKDTVNYKLHSLKNIVTAKEEEYQQKLDSLKSTDTLLAKHAQKLRWLHQVKSIKPKELLADRKTLLEQGILSKAQHFFYSFTRLDIGDTRPFLDAYSTSGINIRGVNLGYKVGKVTLNGFAGSANDIRFTLREKPLLSKRLIMGGSVDYQPVENGRIKLSYLHSASPADTVNTGEFKFSKEHSGDVLGFSSEVGIQKLRISYDLSLSRSLENLSTEFNPGKEEQVLGYAWKMSAERGSTGSGLFRLTAEDITPTYRSAANPYLRTNVQRFTALGRKGFFEEMLQAELFWMKEASHLLSSTVARHRAGSLGGSLSLQIPKLPMLEVRYEPTNTSFQSAVDSILLEGQFNSLLIFAHHRVKLGKSILMLQGNLQRQRSIATELQADGLQVLAMSANLQLKKKIHVGTTFQNVSFGPLSFQRQKNILSLNSRFPVASGTSLGLRLSAADDPLTGQEYAIGTALRSELSESITLTMDARLRWRSSLPLFESLCHLSYSF